MLSTSFPATSLPDPLDVVLALQRTSGSWALALSLFQDSHVWLSQTLSIDSLKQAARRCGAQVAREVFNGCLMGELSSKTRVLVTNQLQFVSAADTVIFMAGGQIAEIGTYADMVAAGKAFSQLMSQAEARP